MGLGLLVSAANDGDPYRHHILETLEKLMASPDPDRRRLVPNTSEVLVLAAAQRGLVVRSASYSASSALHCNPVGVLDSIPISCR